MNISALPIGSRFRVLGCANLTGKLIYVTPGAALVEYDAGGKTFSAHDAEGEPVNVSIAAGKRRVTVALNTGVEAI